MLPILCLTVRDIEVHNKVTTTENLSSDNNTQWSCDRAQVRKMFVMLVEKERKQPTVVAVAAQALAAAGP
jgi:hypothetical protein